MPCMSRNVLLKPVWKKWGVLLILSPRRQTKTAVSAWPICTFSSWFEKHILWHYAWSECVAAGKYDMLKIHNPHENWITIHDSHLCEVSPAQEDNNELSSSSTSAFGRDAKRQRAKRLPLALAARLMKFDNPQSLVIIPQIDSTIFCDQRIYSLGLIQQLLSTNQ